MPIILYIVLVDLNPRYMDFMYNINVILGIVLTLSLLTLENRLYIKVCVPPHLCDSMSN